MKKNVLAKMLVALTVFSLLLAACGSAAPEAESAPAVEEEAAAAAEAGEAAEAEAPAEEAAAPEDAAEAAAGGCALKIGFVSDVGKINDQSFNQASWTGVEDAVARLGLADDCYSFIETADSADYQVNIESFVSEGYNVILTSGFAMTEVTRTVAAENPDVYFIGVDQQQVDADSNPDYMDNVAGLNFHEDIGGFLAGAAAGLMTESNVVGGVFGCQFIPAVARYEVGYHNGVKFVNPDATVLDVYHPGSIDVCFADSAFGSETAQSLVAEGADVIYGAGGLTANGALITGCNKGILVIGTDMDQYLTLPEVQPCILSSAMKDIVTGVSDLIVSVDEGTFAGGDFFGPSALAPFHDLEEDVPDDVKAQLDDIAAELMSGEIDPCTEFEGSNPNTFCVPVSE